ncbi:MAG: hypothetical protein V4596_10355 [Bdellovibrionota bacterium]
MNLKILIVGLLLASSSYAQQNDHRAIYMALNVEEINTSEIPFDGVVKTEKSVGGLTCYRTQAVAPTNKARYACAFDKISLM